MTRAPENDSWAKVLSSLNCSCTLRERVWIKLATRYTKKAKKGRGTKVNNVSLGLTEIMMLMTKMMVNPVFSAYMMAGPTYMRTLLTSSEILFIKSPVLLFL